MGENTPRVVSPEARAAKRSLDSGFRRKGSMFALVSGMSWGMYSTWILVATTHGIWLDWYGDNTAGLSTFAIIYILGILGAGVNDTFCALWTILITCLHGKGKDIIRTVKSKPFKLIVFAALFGACAGALYIVALQMAGTITAPITALYPAMGTIIAAVFLKQKVTFRMWVGVAICIFAAIIIGGTQFSLGGNAFLGIIIAFIAAVSWSLEGVIGGYALTMVDYEIAISCRMCISAIFDLLIVLPVLCAIDPQPGLWGYVISESFLDSSIIFFVISGFFQVFAYAWWYKGNNMRGAAFGMAANGMYSFWIPLFTWLVVGLAFGVDGYQLGAVQWIAAIIMAFGILMIAMNPLDLLRKKEE